MPEHGRPSPWQGCGFRPQGRGQSLACASVHPVFTESTEYVPVVERSTIRRPEDRLLPNGLEHRTAGVAFEA